uniref:Uncharacterized protein n=1 Tax=Pundamilia nyererei TaxID=303518 RepID=A0A3B4FBV8_9CICH
MSSSRVVKVYCAEETNIELFGTNWTCWVGRKTAQTTTTVKHGGEDIVRFSVKDTGQLGCRMELHGLNLDEIFQQDSDRKHTTKATKQQLKNEMKPTQKCTSSNRQ